MFTLSQCYVINVTVQSTVHRVKWRCVSHSLSQTCSILGSAKSSVKSVRSNLIIANCCYKANSGICVCGKKAKRRPWKYLLVWICDCITQVVFTFSFSNLRKTEIPAMKMAEMLHQKLLISCWKSSVANIHLLPLFISLSYPAQNQPLELCTSFCSCK